MTLTNRIKLVSTLLIFVGALGVTSLSAQTWEERQENGSDNHWFWNWLFGKESTGHGYQAFPSDIYEGVVLKINLGRQWKFSIGDNDIWARTDYNDKDWETIKIPSNWENQGFHGYDGYAWYRIHFDGRDLKQNQNHFIILGTIDDVDETYINGTLVGKSGKFPPPFRTAYNHERKYFIPAETINFNGDNLITVRVYDDGLNGGIIDGRPGIYASEGTEDLIQDLYGKWKFTRDNNNSFRQVDYNDQNWENILVPSFWSNQGYRSYDGIAWYRKHFEICFEPEKGKNYYLTLGKIDDFDITYLNGIKIGETDDGKGYGASESYLKMRIYKIPSGLLNVGGENILAVKVFDIGNEGGIYRGPVGIIDESAITKIMRMGNKQ